MDEIQRAAAYWDEHTQKYSDGKTGLFWFEVPEIVRTLNQRASGDPAVEWWDHVLRQHLRHRLPLSRCLSLACGAGKIERDLASRAAFEKCDGYDVSPGSIERARQLAKEEGWNHIDYQVADVNLLNLPPRTYDAVWVYAAMHHFQDLERVVDQIKKTLKPGGLLATCEYVGPPRFCFSARQKELANHCLNLLPVQYRRLCPAAIETLRAASPAIAALPKKRPWSALFGDGENDRQHLRSPEADPIATTVGFPTRQEVITQDPSESVRSNEIVPILLQHFDVIEKRELGGNIFQFLFSGIAQNFQDDDPTGVSLVRMILQIEDVLMKAGEFESDFVFLVAKPKD